MARNNALRGWWKPWTWSTSTWIVAIVLSAVASPFAIRSFCLWQIPDVVLPFDVEDVVQTDVPDDQNAFTIYENALKLLAGKLVAPANSATPAIASNPAVSREELRQRLPSHNEQALAEFIRAGEMERAVGPSVKTGTYWTLLSLHQRLRQLAVFYNSVGQTFEECGETEKAWICHRANLQLSIHTQQPGYAICALIAIAMRTTNMEVIVHWGSNPSVTADQLRSARHEISREFARRIRFFTISKCEYLMARNTLKELEGSELITGNPTGVSSQPKPVLYGLKACLWCIAQPELILRLSRQFLVNNATEFDKPLHQRRHFMVVHEACVFDLDPQVRRIPGQLDAGALTRILESDSRLLSMTKSSLPSIASVDQALRRDDARFAALTVVLAAHEFQRKHGQFPSSIEDLVPSYLGEVPFDPMAPDGSSMHYRQHADGTAIVWSVGPNGIDDQGNMSNSSSNSDILDIGYQIKLNEPAERGSAEESDAIQSKAVETTVETTGEN